MADQPAKFDREHGVIIPPQVRRSTYAYLFAGLSLLLLVGPALDQLLPASASSAIATVCFLGTLLIGVWTLVESVIAFRLGLGLAALAVFFASLEWFVGGFEFDFVTLLIVMAFLVLSVYHAGRDVIFTDVVDFNRLVGAMCIYEMLGLIWAVLYNLIAEFSPEAFAGGSLDSSNSFYDFVYFSFVTLTTLGYGDVAPAGAFTKALAYMEAVVGQLYVAILIAGLVGSHLQGRKHH